MTFSRAWCAWGWLLHAFRFLVALVALACAPDALAQSAPSVTDTDRLIVKLKDRPQALKHQRLESAEARRLGRYAGHELTPYRAMGDGAQVLQLERRMRFADAEAVAQRLRRHPDVEYAVPDRIAHVQYTPIDQLYTQQWNLQATGAGSVGINMPAAWDISTGSSSLVVAVLDTGILPHADLAGSRILAGYDFVQLARGNDGDGRDVNATDPGDWVTTAEATQSGGPFLGCPMQDSSWHGTRMAGIIAANANDLGPGAGVGIAGINLKSKILPVRVIGKCGGYTSDIVDGIRWAAGISVPNVPTNTNPARVINLSIATAGGCDSAYQSAINEATAVGAVVVAAAGNSGQNVANAAPASCANVIAVGAVNRAGGLPSYGNTGLGLTVSAPGGVSGASTSAILTPADGGTQAPLGSSVYPTAQGTSVAAAQVSGVVSLMLSVRPGLSPLRIQQILQATVQPFPTGTGADCNTSLCGAGIVDAAKALTTTTTFARAIPSVTGGTGHMVALREDGTVWAWGQNNERQLGSFTTEDRNPVPARVYDCTATLLRDVVQVSAGFFHTLALKNDGTVWAWGASYDGQIGDGGSTFENRLCASRVSSLADVVQIGTGQGSSFATTRDGALWAWGNNTWGQLGDGNSGLTVKSDTPVRVRGPNGVGFLNGVIAVDGSGLSTFAVTSDGKLWAWGYNKEGQLGTGNTTSTVFPVQVTGITGVVAVAQGGSLAVKSDGTVWAWSKNLGDGTQNTSLTPKQVPGLRSIVSIATGSGHSMALGADGSVWAWGVNYFGQLGIGTIGGTETVPMRVPGLSGVTSVAAGNMQSMAIKPDGSLLTWGANDGGVLGNQDCSPTFECEPRRSPGPVYYPKSPDIFALGPLNPLQFAPVSDAAPGAQISSSALTLSGLPAGATIAIVGGQYSRNGGAFSSTQGSVANGDAIVLRQTAASAFDTTTLAVATIAGQRYPFRVTTIADDSVPNPVFIPSIGNAVPGTLTTSSPVTIKGLSGPAPVTITGGEYSINSGVFTSAPGIISNGQTIAVRLTTATASDAISSATLQIGASAIPFTVITASDAAFATRPKVFKSSGHYPTPGDSISTHRSYEYGAALTKAGTVYKWWAEIATGGTYAVIRRHFDLLPGLSGIRQISTATLGGFVLALGSKGTVWGWGSNGYGQLGDGAGVGELINSGEDVYQDLPVQATGLSNVTQVVGLDRWSAALKADGTAWVWGAVQAAGIFVPRLAPVQVSGVSGVVAIDGGFARTADGSLWRIRSGMAEAVTGVTGVVAVQDDLARKADGTIWQIPDTGAATQVGGLQNIVATAKGGRHWLALRADGTVWAWGIASTNGFFHNNGSGQLGNGTTTDSTTPVQVKNGSGFLTGIIAIAAGDSHSMAQGANGSVWAWGNNSSGQLADGTTTNRLTPVLTLVNPGENSIYAAGNTSYAITPGGQVYAWGSNSDGILSDGNSPAVDHPSPVVVRDLSFSPVSLGAPGFWQDFAGQVSVPVSTLITSETKTLVAVGTNVTISISSGEFSVNGGAFRITATTVSNGDRVAVRMISPAAFSTTASATLTVNGSAYVLRVTTAAVDTSPDPFTLTPVAEVATGSTVLSAPITVTGISSPATISIADGEYSVDGGQFRSTTSTVSAGQTVVVRDTAAAQANQTTAATLTIGDTSAAFRTTTRPLESFAVNAMVAGGAAHALGVKTDGTLWAWGANGQGQLGDGALLDRGAPFQLTGVGGVVEARGGEQHTVVRRSDGTVWAWGRNASGQLGDGTTESRRVPVQVTGLTDAKAIAAGANTSYALRNAGTVVAWGENLRGEVGDNTTAARSAPVTVSGLSNIIAIAARGGRAVALEGGTGKVYKWGEGTQQPVLLTTVAGTTAIAIGRAHVLGLKSDGTMWALGENSFGQLGNNSTGAAAAPVTVVASTGAGTLTTVAEIAAGDDHSLARKSDGTVWAWGANASGQLGNGSSANQQIPVQVSGLSGVRGLGAGRDFSMAIAADYSVRTWGANSLGALGDATRQARIAPVTVLGPESSGRLLLLRLDTTPDPFAFQPRFSAGVNAIVTSSPMVVRGINAPAPVSVSGGKYSINNGAFVTTNGTANENDTVRVQVTSPGTAGAVATATLTIGDESAQFNVVAASAAGGPIQTLIAAGENNTALVKRDGSIWAWGYNGNGQVGNGTNLSISTPIRLGSIANSIAVSTGSNHILAVKSDGTVWGWGWNASGQLGSTNPVPTALRPGTIGGLAGKFVAVAAGGSHSLALTDDGKVWAWGGNGFGQLGDGSTVSRAAPTIIAGLPLIKAIAAGEAHSLALAFDGRIYAWGLNSSGQLGNGTTESRLTPILVADTVGFVQIAAGAAHNLALRADGSLWSWGANGFGQLGDGGTTNRSTPVQVLGLAGGVTAIALGRDHSLAIQTGALYSWGRNDNGQLGRSTTDELGFTPSLVAVAGASFVAVAAGGRHSIALRSDGRIELWGDNFFGQLGNRSGNYSPLSSILNVLRGDSIISQFLALLTGAVGSPSNSSGTSGVDTAKLISELLFQNQRAGTTSVAQRLRFTNDAAQPLNNVDVAVTSPQFTKSHDCPLTLPAGGSCTIDVLFSPSVPGPVNADLVVSSNAVGGEQRIALIATAVNDLPAVEVPGAPTIGTATAGNASVSVPFTTPASNGGAVISGYTASCTSSNGGVSGSNTGGASPIAVGSLTNGKTYTCTVTATNSAGTGPASASSNAIVPAVDTTPDPFIFPAATGVLRGATITSGSVIPTGYNASTAIAVTPGGSYSLNGGAFNTGASAINPGDSVRVRVTASPNPKTQVCATLTIGGIQAPFCATTGTLTLQQFMQVLPILMDE